MIVEQKPGCTIATYGDTDLLTCSVADIGVQKTGGGNKWLGICIETMLIHLVAGLLTCLWSPWLGGMKVNTFLVNFYNSSTGVWNVFV